MAVDLKAELTRPLALILAVLAVLGWSLFVLTSWSSAATQKAQRVRIADLTEKRDTAVAELARQVQASGALADLQAKVAGAQQDLSRVSQTRADVQADLAAAQKGLSNARRELSEADRTLQSQNQKLADAQANADITTPSIDDAGPVVARASRGGRRLGRHSRSRRSYAVRRR
jgi:predicted  nucleic acid-binding Zn-ribbon protein